MVKPRQCSLSLIIVCDRLLGNTARTKPDGTRPKGIDGVVLMQTAPRRRPYETVACAKTRQSFLGGAPGPWVVQGNGMQHASNGAEVNAIIATETTRVGGVK